MAKRKQRNISPDETHEAIESTAEHIRSSKKLKSATRRSIRDALDIVERTRARIAASLRPAAARDV